MELGDMDTIEIYSEPSANGMPVVKLTSSSVDKIFEITASIVHIVFTARSKQTGSFMIEYGKCNIKTFIVMKITCIMYVSMRYTTR